MSKIYNTLNRALIKKLEVLPNVFDFSTEKYGIHEYAAIYGIEKVLRRSTVTKLLKSAPNFYLERQHKRLITLAASGQVAGFIYLSQIILRKSKSFRILSLNRTVKDWFILPIRNLRKIWRELNFISNNLSSDLKFKRVWIDKKEGDYARPLGVPLPSWRCYSFMWMDHIEKFQKASNNLAKWQHGGRSGVGVLSCYKQLIPRLKEANTIYEFDIKGFFDNISHERIIERFEETMGPIVSEWIARILIAKPTSYTLPPLDRDQAVLAQENLISMTESVLDDFEELMNLPLEEGEADPADLIFAILQNEGDSPEVVLTKLMDELKGFIDAEVPLEKVYELQLRGIPNPSILDYLELERFTEQDRARGRDAWKNLGQPGRGVPQGLGTSPFISTFMTDTYLKTLGINNNLIMYMDDGILFAKSPQEMNKLLARLKEGLEAMGLELAPEKSKLVKKSNKWIDSIKFLGLRYLPETDTFMSDTRSGTKIQFPAQGNWEDIKNMAALNHTGVSNMRIKFDKLINTQAYEAGLKYGFLGCMIAGSQYKDNLPMESRKEEIRQGQNKAWANVIGSKGFIWKSQDLVNHSEYLTNVSSIACHRFAEFNRKGRKLFIRKGKLSTRRRI